MEQCGPDVVCTWTQHIILLQFSHSSADQQLAEVMHNEAVTEGREGVSESREENRKQVKDKSSLAGEEELDTHNSS